MLRRLFGSRRGAAEKPLILSPSGAGVDPPVSVSGELDAALQHHQAGRLSEAEAAYRGMLAVDPDNIDALHFLGVIFHQRGEHERAAELISRALSRNPSNAPAHNNLGNTLGAQGKLNEAVVSYLNALALEPDYVDALVNLGAALRAQGRLDRALACYKRALSLAPNAPAARAGLQDVLKAENNVGKAAVHDDRAPTLAPESCEWHFDQGNSYKDHSQWDEAVASYEKALSLNPDFSSAYVNLGNVLNVQGKPDQAIACYRKALVLDPDLLEAHYNLADVMRDQNRLSEAIPCYEKVIVLRPDLPEAHYGLGHVFRNQGRLYEGLACNKKALSLNPEYVEARWALAMSQVPKMYGTDADPVSCRTAFAGQLDELERWFDGTRRAADGRVVRAAGLCRSRKAQLRRRDPYRRPLAILLEPLGLERHRQGLVRENRPRALRALRVLFRRSSRPGDPACEVFRNAFRARGKTSAAVGAGHHRPATGRADLSGDRDGSAVDKAREPALSAGAGGDVGTSRDDRAADDRLLPVRGRNGASRCAGELHGTAHHLAQSGVFLPGLGE